MTTCTEVNAGICAPGAHPDASSISIYHGIDIAAIPAAARPRVREGDGTRSRSTGRILAVGRAVDKKGFDDLLAALARLPPRLALAIRPTSAAARCCASFGRWRAAGHRRAGSSWRGAQAQQAVLAALSGRGHLRAALSRVSDDGDRDGLAQRAAGSAEPEAALRVDAVSGIPELIEHDVTGLLVEPRAIAALADALVAR